MQKQFLIPFFSALFIISCTNSMENKHYSDDDTISVQLLGKSFKKDQKKIYDATKYFVEDAVVSPIAYAIDLPYKAAKLSKTLVNNMSDTQDHSPIITIANTIASVSPLSLAVTLEIMKSEIKESLIKRTASRLSKKNDLLSLLRAVEYLDCQEHIGVIYANALQQKLQTLVVQKNKVKKALKFARIIESTDHYDQLFSCLCSNLKYKTEIATQFDFMKEFTLDGHTAQVLSLHFLPDSKKLASGSFDNTVRIWDVATNTCEDIIKGHRLAISSVSFSPDGLTIASGSYDKYVRIWDATTHICCFGILNKAAIKSVCYSADGSLLVCASGTKILIINTSTHKLMKTIATDNHVGRVAFSSDHSKVISSGTNDTIQVFDSTHGNCLQEFKGHTSFAKIACFFSNDTRIASGSFDRTVRIWDVATGECLHVFKGINSSCAMCISPDETVIAYAAFADKKLIIKLYDIASENCLKIFKLNGIDIESLCFSPDGKRLAVGTFNKKIFIITFPDIQKEFTLSSLLFLEYLMHQKKQGTLQKLPTDWNYLHLFSQLPETFQKQFPNIFDYQALAKELQKKDGTE